jgi:hypothetical protein
MNTYIKRYRRIYTFQDNSSVLRLVEYTPRKIGPRPQESCDDATALGLRVWLHENRFSSTRGSIQPHICMYCIPGTTISIYIYLLSYIYVQSIGYFRESFYIPRRVNTYDTRMNCTDPHHNLTSSRRVVRDNNGIIFC